MNDERILFKCLGGSYLYGTNSESSDKDYKGVFLPNIKDLILGKAPKHYTSSTGSSTNKNTANDVDETYYSLQYFLELAAKGDTNAIDILFAYTNYEAVIIDTPIWSELIQNIDKILTKNVKAYLGYCKSQSQKYSIKGDKLNNFNKFANFLSRENSYTWAEEGDITLYHCLNFVLKGDFNNKVLDKFIPKADEERIKFTEIDFGDHCYIETANNKESYLVISGIKFPLNDWCKSNMNKVEKVIYSYGKRSESAANENGVDWKAISHCVRVLIQVEELLTLNKITFPLINTEFVKSIKYNTSNMTYEEIMKWIEEKISLIDNRLLPNSTLREKADYKWIEKFILKQYERK